MQVSAVGSNLNNISFSSNSRYEHRPYQDYDNYDEYDEYIEGDSVEFGSQRISDDEMNELMLASKNVSDTAHKASQDVSPVTVVASLGAALATIGAIKGKVMPLSRKVAATAIEKISCAATNLYGYFKKADVSKPIDKIQHFTDAIRSDAPNENVLNEMGDWALKITGDAKKAEAFKNTLKKQGITNIGQIFDFATGVLVAWGVADGASDAVESGIDNAKVQSAVSQLKALAGSLGLDFTDDQITSLINKKLSHDKAA